MEDRMPQDNVFTNFQVEYKQIAGQDTVSEDDFLNLASEAIEVYRKNPEKREELARMMAGLWLNNDEIEEGSAIDDIGGEFADLEVPDTHIDLSGHDSVEEKWNALAEKIERELKF